MKCSSIRIPFLEGGKNTLTDEPSPTPAFESEREFDLLQDSVIVAHNLQIDQNFLAGEFRRLGRYWPDTLGEIDTLELSIRYFPNERGHKLAMMSERLGVTLKGAHRASNDAEACGRCFTELARRTNAPEDFEDLLEWAGALGRPPEGHWIRRAPERTLVFGEGLHEGEPIEEHLKHLQWMLVAKDRKDGQWKPRYPENLRRWIERYLKSRCAGRARGNGKSFRTDGLGHRQQRGHAPIELKLRKLIAPALPSPVRTATAIVLLSGCAGLQPKLAHYDALISQQDREISALLQRQALLQKHLERCDDPTQSPPAIFHELKQVLTHGHRITREGRRVTVHLPNTLLFNRGLKPKIRRDAAMLLDLLSTALNLHPEHGLVFEAHSDNQRTGSSSYPTNWELGAVRAAAVARALIKDYRVEPGRVTVASRAEMDPIGENSTAEGRAANRRVLLHIETKE